MGSFRDCAHEERTRLIRPSMGMKVIFVRLLARQRRNVVAADVGVS